MKPGALTSYGSQLDSRTCTAVPHLVGVDQPPGSFQICPAPSSSSAPASPYPGDDVGDSGVSALSRPPARLRRPRGRHLPGSGLPPPLPPPTPLPPPPPYADERLVYDPSSPSGALPRRRALNDRSRVGVPAGDDHPLPPGVPKRDGVPGARELEQGVPGDRAPPPCSGTIR